MRLSQQTKTKIRDAIMKMKLSALTLAISTASLTAPLNIAHAAETGATAEMEKVTVTGSRIKRTEIEGVAPLTIIDAQEIENSGFATIADVLESSLANNGASFNGDEASGYTTGASSVNLRGMGASRTLVLINGRRQAQFPTAAGGTDNFVDVSDIPSSAVARVEILTGGASAIYGSDAVGGVVNIILKDHYEGGTASVKFENPQHGGRDNLKFSYTQGINTENSNSIVIFEYQKAEELLMGQRLDYYQEGLNRGFDTPGLVPSKYIVDPDTGKPLPWTEDWQWGAALPSSWGANLIDYKKVYHDSKYPVTQDQCANILGDKGVWYTPSSYKCRYDKYRGRGLESAYDRLNLVVNSQYQLNEDWQLYGMINASYKDSDKYKDKKGMTVSFYEDQDTGALSYEKQNKSDNKFQLRRRMEEFSNLPDSRIYSSTNEKYSIAFGANGLIGDYDFDISWSSGYNRYHRDSQSQVNRQALLENITFNPNDPDSSKWYPLDKMTDAQVAAMYGVSTKRSSSQIHQLSSVLSGDLMELPAGTLSFATSLEWARESYDDELDPTTSSGGFVGMGGTGGEGSRDRYAGAAELLIPLLADITAVKRLELSIAGRYDYYNDDTEVNGYFSPQIGLMYHPTDNVLIRGSWGESFRAPDMHRIYAGPTIGFSEIDYQLSNGEIYEDSYRSINSGNRNLGEETGEYASIGIVANLADGLDMTLDWWSIELNGAVRTIPSDQIYNGPNDFDPKYNYTGQASDCSNISGIGFILEEDDSGFENLKCMRKGPFNSAMEKSTGIDAEISYRLEYDRYGYLKTKLGASYLKEKLVQDYEGGEIENYVDTYYYPTWKGKASLTWGIEDFTTTLSYYYTGTATGEDLFDYQPVGSDDAVEEIMQDKLAAYGRLNWSASYKLPWKGKVKLGINNITDEMPPYYNVRNDDYNSSPFYRTGRGYSMTGRSFYFGYSQSF